MQDDKRMEPSQDTEDLALRYPPPAPLTDENLVQQQAAQAQADPFSFKPPSYAAATSQSPGFSPLSMDLTNNSFDTNQMRGSQQGGSQQWQAAAPSPGGDYFTRNITGNIPNLSTLVEEDEECGYEVSQQGQQQQQQAVPITALSPLENTSPMAGLAMPPPQNNSAAPLAMSPASPFVLQEMQRRGESDDEDVKNKWGFAPGADDTLEVSYGK